MTVRCSYCERDYGPRGELAHSEARTVMYPVGAGGDETARLCSATCLHTNADVALVHGTLAQAAATRMGR